MDPKEISKFADLLRNNGDKVLNADFKLSLSGSLLRALNDSFTLIIDEREEKAPPQTFQVLKVNNFKSNVFRDLQIIFDFFQKTEALCLCNFIDDDPFDGIIDLVTFRNLRKLEVQKISIKQVIGIQQLRAQIQEVVCVKCITNVKELLVDCGGDHSNSFIWNELRKADFSFNSLHVVDSSFEFTPYVQNLNLSHNKIVNVSAIKWLPNLKVLNLSFNQLTHIPKFNLEAYRKLQVLIINDNFIEDVSGLTRLDALTELDLSGNCLLDHSILLPLSSLSSLTSLNLSCNPLGCHPKHRVATCRYLNKNAANGKFLLDEELLSKKEKSLAGAYEHYFPLYGNRFSTQTPSLRSRCDSNISTNSFTSINSASDLQSQDTSQEVIISRRVKPRSVVIEDLDNQKNATKIESKLQVKNDRKIEGNKKHLETKKQIEELRQKFGNEWLNHGANEVQNVMGFEALSPDSRRKERWSSLLSSSPDREESLIGSQNMTTSTPIEAKKSDENSASISGTGTIYKSAQNDSDVYETAVEEQTYQELDLEVEEAISEPEENEAKFNVTDEETHTDCLLVISEETIKEKDPATGRTKIKWGMSSLESCERIKMNLIRLNFDTIRKDKKERLYDMDPKECQELERLLREILANRPLSEMNMNVYKCAKCNTQFSREINPNKKTLADIKCPECNNIYVILIQSGSEKSTSPKQKLSIRESGILRHFNQTSGVDVSKKINLLTKNDSQTSIGSAGSLKDSSSCSQISRTDSSFDSNRSVAGSSNSERDKDVDLLKVDLESDIEVLSNPSQSSIEVLDRKHSEERRISQVPSLDTIEDDSVNQSNLSTTITASYEEAGAAEVATEAITEKKSEEVMLKSKTLLGIQNVNLTESSSSGSVTDSVCTAYESANGEKLKNSIMSKSNESSKETIVEVPETTAVQKQSPPAKTQDGLGFTSMLGGLLHSTNLLMSKTPKPKKEIESTESFPYEPIRYNYENFSIVDHRLKLFLFQSIMEDRDEKFVWLARGFICENEDVNGRIGPRYYGILMMSTTKFYVLREVGDESEEISLWLKRQMAVSVDRVEHIKVLPWKIGVTFRLKGFGSLHLLLQDVTRTGGLLYYLGNGKVPDSCTIDMTISESQQEKIFKITNHDDPIVMVVYKSVFVSSDVKTEIKTGCFIVTETDLYLTKSDFQWIYENLEQDIPLFSRQPMTNLVELEGVTNSTFILNFMDETEDRTESWKFEFETKLCIDNTLKSISKVWEKVFGMPLMD